MAKRRTIQDKRKLKQAQLATRAAKIWDISETNTMPLLSNTLVQSVRINTLKTDPAIALSELVKLGWEGERIPWCDHAYSITKGYETLRDSNLVAEGKIYIQNEASFLPVIALDPQPGENVLDMCAAPGGKTSHIAALMQNQGKLVANDNSRTRLMKLRANLERLGVNAELTLYDATHIHIRHKLPNETFGRILLDAPCSGEGLINLDIPATLDTWSVAHIRRLASLQKQLIREAWRLLRPGGRLVYSTCTMAPEENEQVIDWLLKRSPEASVISINLPGLNPQEGIIEWNGRPLDPRVAHTLRLKPAHGREAFFVCALEKAA